MDQKLTKNLSISEDSSSYYPVSGPSSSCNNQYAFFYTSLVSGATNYNWVWPEGWTYVAGQGTYYLLLITGTSGGPVTVKVTNACNAGGGNPPIHYVEVNNCSFVMNAAPNPTVSDVTITTGQTQSLPSGLATPDKIYKLELLDILGNIKKKLSYSSGETNIKLNLGTLVNGTYVIRVYNGRVWAHKKIVVAH